MNNAIKLIKSLNIYEDYYVVLACSYGPDSMCLLDLLLKCNLRVVVAHVNHKLREESNKEYTDLEKHCQSNNIIFEGASIEEYPKGNVENMARQFRYDFFDKIVKKYKTNYLFTAHHGDDLMETILMRINRGSSFKGYAGFNAITHKDNYDIIRPLIYLTKDDIIKYNKDNNIPYAIDNTNLETVHTRNKYRHKILPTLKEINPNIHEKFIKFSNTINEYNDYVDEVVNTKYSELYNDNHLDLNEFNILPTLIKKCILNKILFNIYNNSINNINDEHIKLIFELIDSEKVNSFICLPHNIKVCKFYNILEFQKNEDINDFDYIFDNSINVYNGCILKIDETSIIKSNYILRLNSKDISLPIHIRNRRDGDKISLKNSGTKKVNDVFIDSKLSKKERDSYPIVTDNNDNILWIPGIKKCKLDKQSNEEYDIILKYIKKGEEL